MRRAVILLGAMAGLLAARDAPAQDSTRSLPPAPAVVSGRVVIPAPDTETPVPGVMVTVHRVGSDSAGPLDSARTDARGRYTVRYTRFGSEDALYFAAAVYDGIAYFTSPLRGERTEGDDAAITVFDTTSRPVTLTIQGHHVVVSAPDATGAREVVEVYELSNDTTVTLVVRGPEPIWSAPLPAGATNFSPGPGDVAAAALTRRDDRVELFAPFGPGIKQLSFSYVLQDGDFPLRVTLERQTGVFEVLLEEQAAQARGPTLRAQGSVNTQGRTFKRFLAQGAPAGETFRIDVPTAAGATRVNVVIAVVVVIVLAMVAAFWRALSRHAPRPARVATAASVDAPATPDALVAAIAALDARREAGDAPLDDAHYTAERAALKARLAAALAAQNTAR